MNILFLFCSLVYVLTKGIFVAGTTEYDAPLEIQLYHTTDGSSNPEWIENGNVTLQNINTGSFFVSQPPIHGNSEFMRKLEDAALSNRLYRIKFLVRTSKGKEIPFYSYLKAKSFIEAGFQLNIVVSLDQNGSVIGIKAYTDKQRSKHAANISFKVAEQGPIPDTATYILKLEREREAKERGATQDNRSLLAKYWMYIIPFVLFAVLSGTSGDAGAGGGGAASR